MIMRSRFHCIVLTLLVLRLSSSLTSAKRRWNCSPKCPDYDDCMGGKDRFLLEERNTTFEVEASNKQRHHPSLRRRRQLQQEETAFLLKLYHEESPDYCWQSEWEDRYWCLECYQCGDCDPVTCDVGDSLWIKYCDGSKREQYLTYEPVSSGGVRLKPYMNPFLCLEWDGPGERNLSLQPCDSSNTRQILVGFDIDRGKFELHPFNKDPDSTSDPLCLTQAHHPKKREVLKVYSCETARKDRTSFWQVHETVVEADLLHIMYDDETAEPTMTPTADDEYTTAWPTPFSKYSNVVASPIEMHSPVQSPTNLPELQDYGSDACTPDNPCEHCEGDCATDFDCAGDLECFHRTYKEEVPSCLGGGDMDNRRDFCIPPQYNTRPQVQDNGSDACTESNPCPHCVGDCDSDDECEGSLQCFKRRTNQAVPSCRGGEYIDNKRDFCVLPEYN